MVGLSFQGALLEFLLPLLEISVFFYVNFSFDLIRNVDFVL
jgi:hypothetical protein